MFLTELPVSNTTPVGTRLYGSPAVAPQIYCVSAFYKSGEGFSAKEGLLKVRTAWAVTSTA